MEATHITLYFFIVISSLFCVHAVGSSSRKGKEPAVSPPRPSRNAFENDREVLHQIKKFLLQADEEYLHGNTLVCKADELVKQKIGAYVAYTLFDDFDPWNVILRNVECEQRTVLYEGPKSKSIVQLDVFCFKLKFPLWHIHNIYCISQGADDDHIFVYSQDEYNEILTVEGVVELPHEIRMYLNQSTNEESSSDEDSGQELLKPLLATKKSKNRDNIAKGKN